ncbi:MAG: DNA polymerase III subunit chi [Propionivibrio sp.]
MTQIFFYHNAADRIATAAALIGKAFLQRKALLVYAPDAAIASTLDRQLWVHPATGFIPHVRNDSPLAGQTPVLIADQIDALDATAQHERVFNLSSDIPPGFSRFTSVIEVVGRDDDERQAGRERARFYKDRGYAIKYVELAEKH